MARPTIDDTDLRPAARADAGLPGLIQFFEQLSPQNLTRLGELYAPDAHFKDPFNDVQGVMAIQAIFDHMFRSMVEPRFAVLSQMSKDDQAFLVWDLRFRFPGQADVQCIHGATHLHFDVQGRVLSHRDYWDAAEELYEKLPVLGAFMRWLKRRATRG